MVDGSTGAENPTERWDQLYDVLSAEPRRMIILRLMDEPKERRLSLPEAAEPLNESIDAETLHVQLRHHHLPVMADAGYIRWEDGPFRVQRGPHFQEPATIIDRVTNQVDQLPNSLIRECELLRERANEK